MSNHFAAAKSDKGQEMWLKALSDLGRSTGQVAWRSDLEFI